MPGPLSLDAAIFVYNSDAEDNDDDYSESIPMHKRELGRRIYKKVVTINPVSENFVNRMSEGAISWGVTNSLDELF